MRPIYSLPHLKSLIHSTHPSVSSGLRATGSRAQSLVLQPGSTLAPPLSGAVGFSQITAPLNPSSLAHPLNRDDRFLHLEVPVLGRTSPTPTAISHGPASEPPQRFA